MTLGSLFDGAGTCCFAAELCGITPVWSSEIEKFPLAVTAKRFPQVKQLGDITKINGAEIEPVDIISFGSPCQDLSVAGKRKGFGGEHSVLFLEAVRIIKEMRYATANEFPRYAVWENVVGAFSSNGGEDFLTVIEELCKVSDNSAAIPRPTGGGDVIRWGGAGLIMADRYSVAWRVLDAQFWGVPQRRRRIYLVADFGGGRAPEILFKRESLSRRTQAGRTTRQGSPADTSGSSGKAIGFNYRMGSRAGSVGEATEQSGTLKAGCNDHAVCVPAPIGFNYTNSITARVNPIVDKTEPLRASGGGAAAVCGSEGYIVRRLTPLECGRLQGMPDWWCSDVPHADAPEYKMWGNGMALPCVLYVFEGLKKYDQERRITS